MKNVNKDFDKMLEGGFFDGERHENLQFVSREEHAESHSFGRLHTVENGRINCSGIHGEEPSCPYCEAEKLLKEGK